MTQLESNCYALPVKAAEMLTRRSGDKLLPTLMLDEVAAPAKVLDCFDQSLRRSGMLLLETGGSLELLMPDGRVLSQSAKRKGRFVSDFQQGSVKLALTNISPIRSLLPIGSGTVRRGLFALLDDEQKTHCRAQLHFLTGDGGKGAVIITLQGLRGYDKSLAEMRKHVAACGGIQLSQSRVYSDIFSGHIAYDPKPEVPVEPDDTAFEAATDIIAAYIPVARANEGGIIADYDTEFLHDYRVALRKIRSVLSLFKDVYDESQTADIKDRFADLMGPTGRLRDLDVYLLEKQRYYDLLPNTLHGGLDAIFKMFAEERKVEKANLSRHLESKTYEKEISSLARLFKKRRKLNAGPKAELAAHVYACDLIWQRYRKICRIAAGIGPETDDAEVHILRIHCKKLRYLMEFFAPLFPKPDFKSLIKPLKLLQENLGFYHDYAVQQVSLQDYVRGRAELPSGVNIEIAQSVGALTAVLHRWQLEERAKVVASIAQFNSPATQQTFRTLFHERSEKK